MNDLLEFLGRKRPLFVEDLEGVRFRISDLVKGADFLVIGGAGSIGQQVVKQLFSHDPRRLHVIDLSENNLVELVRDVRSTLGRISGDFQTLPLDCGSVEFEAFMATQEPYQYVLNLSALKHVRTEKDPFSLMRMIAVNVLNTESTLRIAAEMRVRKYFAVSTDKAVGPANAMGATKSIMERCLRRASAKTPVSSARFANVAFSDGSLLHGFRQRVEKRQPLSAPRDLKRYFITPEESGILCLLSCMVGENCEVFYPKVGDELTLVGFPEIATRYLRSLGYDPLPCATEEEARRKVEEAIPRKKWPCLFFDSDTSGEKEAEEFVGSDDIVDLKRFRDIGVIKGQSAHTDTDLERFLEDVHSLRNAKRWSKEELLSLLCGLVPSFAHREKHKSLDSRM